jgi:hypothetical protein
MERLLVVKLDALDCDAELRLNDFPLLRVDPARPSAQMPVHEFTTAGNNRLELVIWPRPAHERAAEAPPPLACVADGQRAARARILLPRIGSVADETGARTLAQLDWAPPAGSGYEAPLTLQQDVMLPVNFPRWRWLEAPQIEDPLAHRANAFAFVRGIAEDLERGQAERMLLATRLRTEELALAYLRRPEDETARWRDQLLAWHADGRLRWLPLEAETFALRAVAGGRLLECLDGEGAPALRTEPDEHGRSLALPLRMAAVEGNFYVLR